MLFVIVFLSIQMENSEPINLIVGQNLREDSQTCQTDQVFQCACHNKGLC